MPEPVTVAASFKPVENAVTVDGNGDGGKMVLVFDRSQVAQALEAWVLYAGKGFRLTFEPEDQV